MLKRQKLGLCNDSCIDRCIAEEAIIQKEIIEFLTSCGCAYSCSRTDDGISVVIESAKVVEKFYILYVKGQVRVEYEAYDGNGPASQKTIVVFRDVPEVVQFIARNMRLDS